MQFRVVIPEHVRSGQYIKVHCPPDGKGSEGREAELRVPKGLKPGDSFVFDISDKDSSITIASDVTNLNSQIAQNGGGGAKNKKNNTTSSGAGGPGNFLDREVLHLRDFLVALGIGLIIGISIVVGFVMGVLSATSGISESNFHESLGAAANPSVGVYQLQSVKDGLHRPKHHEL